MGNSFAYFFILFVVYNEVEDKQCKSLSGGTHPAVSPIVQHATKVDITREGQLHHILGLELWMLLPWLIRLPFGWHYLFAFEMVIL
jgi:hypothetical protein